VQQTAQRGLFDQPAQPEVTAPHPALDALDDIRPDELSPREALEKLYQLKLMLEAKP